MLNRCEFIGNLGRDPEVRHTQDGKAIVNMSLAVTETWRDKNSGERKEKTEWVRVVIFNEKIGEVAQKYLRKGSKIFVAGAMATRKWTDQQGVEKYSTEIVLSNFDSKLIMLDPKGSAGDHGPMPGSLGDTASPDAGPDDDDPGIPF